MPTGGRAIRGSIARDPYRGSAAADTLEFVLTLRDHRPLLIAHRAGNELSRAHAALTAGADLLEADVWMYRGRLEVRHEKTIRGVPLLWDRWRLMPAFGPRLLLDDMLGALDPGTGLMLDLKGNDSRLAAAVDAVLRRYPRTGVVAVCSQNWRHVDAFAGRPDIAAVHSIGGARRLRRVLASGRRFDAISLNARLLTPDLVHAVRERAALVMSWHVRDAAAAARLIADGTGALILDDLALIRQLRSSSRPPSA